MFKQRSNLRLGALVMTWQGVASLMSIISFIIIISVGWHDYKDVILIYLPWFSLIWAYVLAFAIVMVVGIIWFTVIQPSMQAYVNSLEYAHKSPIKKDLEQIKKKLRIEDED